MFKIHFLGAAGTVTGSKYVIDAEGHRFMVDCGLFQGHKELRLRNWDPLPIQPSSVEAMVITHAHIDHTGYLPRFCRDGFRGPAICTHGTQDLTDLLLRDSAHLQEEQANYVNRKGLTRHKPAQPLYSLADAEYSLTRLRPVDYHKEFQVVEGVTGTFHDAGHILGSTWLELRFASSGKRLVFSGDLGRSDAPILRDPEPLEGADYLILESTYGDRLHPDVDHEAELADLIRYIVRKRGVMVIPAFAVERTQEILYLLRQIHGQSELPHIPVAIDSPMAVRATRLFQKYPEYYDEQAKRMVDMGRKVLDYPGLRLCETVSQSKALASLKPPFVLLAASGMAVGGRILHHLQRYLPDPKSLVLLVGYQSVGSRGWRLQQGEKRIRIFGEWVDVRAEVRKLEGFSGHADYGQIDTWLGQLKQPPKTCFLTHGDPPALEAQRHRLSERGWNVRVPAHLEEVELE